MNNYVLDENMVNWIKTRMEDYKRLPKGGITEIHIDLMDQWSEEVMEWNNKKKIELGRCIWTMVWRDQEYKPEDFRFIHNLVILETVSLFFGSIE